MYQQLQSTDTVWHEVIAITYTVAWASESIIQTYRNYSLKSMEGYSCDYFALAFFGSAWYCLYSCIGFFTSIEGSGTVVLGDLIFSIENFTMMIVQAYQFYIYPRGKNRLSLKAVFICVSMWLFVICYIFLSQIFGVVGKTKYWNVLSLLGYCKLFISLLKYMPAVYWNFKIKSTRGWPTIKIIMDVIGGTFSLASGSVSVSDGLNITKLCLAILTLVYDFIFLFQRFVLYPPKKSSNQQRSLIASEQKV